MQEVLFNSFFVSNRIKLDYIGLVLQSLRELKCLKETWIQSVDKKKVCILLKELRSCEKTYLKVQNWSYSRRILKKLNCLNESWIENIDLNSNHNLIESLISISNNFLKIDTMNSRKQILQKISYRPYTYHELYNVLVLQFPKVLGTIIVDYVWYEMYKYHDVYMPPRKNAQYIYKNLGVNVRNTIDIFDISIDDFVFKTIDEFTMQSSCLDNEYLYFLDIGYVIFHKINLNNFTVCSFDIKDLVFPEKIINTKIHVHDNVLYVSFQISPKEYVISKCDLEDLKYVNSCNIFISDKTRYSDAYFVFRNNHIIYYYNTKKDKINMTKFYFESKECSDCIINIFPESNKYLKDIRYTNYEVFYSIINNILHIIYMLDNRFFLTIFSDEQMDFISCYPILNIDLQTMECVLTIKYCKFTKKYYLFSADPNSPIKTLIYHTWYDES